MIGRGEDGRAVCRFVEDDSFGSGRGQKITNELLNGVGPSDNINLFARQLLHDGLNANPSLPNTGAYRINTAVVGVNGDQGALATLPHYALDLNSTARDRRNVFAKQPPDLFDISLLIMHALILVKA